MSTPIDLPAPPDLIDEQAAPNAARADPFDPGRPRPRPRRPHATASRSRHRAPAPGGLHTGTDRTSTGCGRSG
ncbi:hypothetical protein [Streptomyces sp. TLI_171]|uniref:hypothetical protein n=1 Tax=Streptomyces sp. TLI_171 TaxID=1938859 RepID=UPI000C1A88C0|nr:hypothetical protein [Streptomyces sp. TLI_171]RKE23196.1 hypothetical protein BX266_6654 [Streptomyces sp. TLI_171]